jgi:hypothetical protein
MNIKFTLFFALILITRLAVSQTITIKGKVTSSEDQQGIPGVSVLIKGTVKGITTDIDGNYSLAGVAPRDTRRIFTSVNRPVLMCC